METQSLHEADEDVVTDVDFTSMISEEEKEELKIELAKVMSLNFWVGVIVSTSVNWKLLIVGWSIHHKGMPFLFGKTILGYNNVKKLIFLYLFFEG